MKEQYSNSVKSAKAETLYHSLFIENPHKQNANIRFQTDEIQFATFLQRQSENQSEIQFTLTELNTQNDLLTHGLSSLHFAISNSFFFRRSLSISFFRDHHTKFNADVNNFGFVWFFSQLHVYAYIRRFFFSLSRHF